MNPRRLLIILVAAISLLSVSCARQLNSRDGLPVGVPVDLNDLGTILSVDYEGDVPHAVLLSEADGLSTRIDGPDGAGFVPTALNQFSTMVGSVITGSGREVTSRAAVWIRGRGITLLPLPEGTFQSWATDVNEHAEITMNAYSPGGSPADGAYIVFGISAFTGEPLKFVRLPEPIGIPNGRPTVAEAITDGGVAVGASGNGSAAGLERAVEWERALRPGRFLETRGVLSHALDINEHGTIVGYGVTTPGEPSRALSWLQGPDDRTLIDLGPGLAKSVNESDWLVGQDTSTSPPTAVAWSARFRTRFQLGQLRPGTASIASALNNLSFAVGDTGGLSTYYSLQPDAPLN